MTIPNNDKWKDFIELFQTYPEVWKVKSDEYKDKNKRNKAWNILLHNFKLIEPEANLEVMKKN